MPGMCRCHLGGKLTLIPSHTDHKEFAWKVYASFEVPKACNWAMGMGNYHMQPPAHPSIRKHQFLSLKDMGFRAQDICLTQVQHTIAYVRVLQHWAEEVHPPIPSQPHCLVRSVWELQWQWSPSPLAPKEMSLWPQCHPHGQK